MSRKRTVSIIVLISVWALNSNSMSELIYCPMLRYDIEECAMLVAQSYADY